MEASDEDYASSQNSQCFTGLAACAPLTGDMPYMMQSLFLVVCQCTGEGGHATTCSAQFGINVMPWTTSPPTLENAKNSLLAAASQLAPPALMPKKPARTSAAPPNMKLADEALDSQAGRLKMASRTTASGTCMDSPTVATVGPAWHTQALHQCISMFSTSSSPGYQMPVRSPRQGSMTCQQLTHKHHCSRPQVVREHIVKQTCRQRKSS